MFAFIVAKPGNMLFRRAMSKTQPARTRAPIDMTMRLDTAVRRRSRTTRRFVEEEITPRFYPAGAAGVQIVVMA